MGEHPPRKNSMPRRRDPEVEERLAGVDEFKDRAESWMKEITTQVARLASGSESEEKKRNALDKRLADIEQRIQSLLTLTEMISADQNPFVGQNDRSGAGATSAPGASGGAGAGHMSQNVYVAGEHGQPRAVQGDPAPSTANGAIIDVPHAAAPTGRPETAPTEPAAASSEVAVAVAPSPSPAASAPSPTASAPATPPEETGTDAYGSPSATDAQEGGDRDDEADDARYKRPASSPSPETPMAGQGRRMQPVVPAMGSSYKASHRHGAHPARGPTASDAPALNANPNGARERVLTLELAHALAQAMPRSEIHDFLDHYVDAGWMEPVMAARIMSLAIGMQHDDPSRPDDEALHRLHVRVTVMLSYLEGERLDVTEVNRTIQEADEVLAGDWLNE